MALTKEIRHDVTVRGDYLVICQEITAILDSGKDVSKSIVNKVYYPDGDWSSEPTKVQKVCDIHFTNAIKTSWAALDDSEKSEYQIS